MSKTTKSTGEDGFPQSLDWSVRREVARAGQGSQDKDQRSPEAQCLWREFGTLLFLMGKC